MPPKMRKRTASVKENTDAKRVHFESEQRDDLDDRDVRHLAEDNSESDKDELSSESDKDESLLSADSPSSENKTEENRCEILKERMFGSSREDYILDIRADSLANIEKQIKFASDAQLEIFEKKKSEQVDSENYNLYSKYMGYVVEHLRELSNLSNVKKYYIETNTPSSSRDVIVGQQQTIVNSKEVSKEDYPQYHFGEDNVAKLLWALHEFKELMINKDQPLS
eukprot:Awhi_evm1s644